LSEERTFRGGKTAAVGGRKPARRKDGSAIGVERKKEGGHTERTVTYSQGEEIYPK